MNWKYIAFFQAPGKISTVEYDSETLFNGLIVACPDSNF